MRSETPQCTSLKAALLHVGTGKVRRYRAKAIHVRVVIKVEVEDTTFEAKSKAKDSKKFRDQDQGPTFRGPALSRPRTGMVEAKAKDQGHNFSK